MCEFRIGHKQSNDEAEAARIVASATGLYICRNDIGMGSAPADYRLIDAAFKPVGLLEITSIRDARRTATMSALSKKHPNLTISVPFTTFAWSIGTDERLRVKGLDQAVAEAVREIENREHIDAAVIEPLPWQTRYELPEHINRRLYQLGVTRITRHPQINHPGTVFISNTTAFFAASWEAVCMAVSEEAQKNREKFANSPVTELRELFMWLEADEFGIGGYLNSQPTGMVDLLPEFSGMYIATRGTTARPTLVWHTDGGTWRAVRSPAEPN